MTNGFIRLIGLALALGLNQLCAPIALANQDESDVIRYPLPNNNPFPIARAMGLAFDVLSAVSGGLVPAQITRDQVRNLAKDNVVSEGAKEFSDLGITPVSLEAVLPEYLWRFRPSGQYDEIKESAKTLRA